MIFQTGDVTKIGAINIYKVPQHIASQRCAGMGAGGAPPARSPDWVTDPGDRAMVLPLPELPATEGRRRRETLQLHICRPGECDTRIYKRILPDGTEERWL